MAHDAIALLDADHQRVEGLFREFRSAGGDASASIFFLNSSTEMK